MENEKDKNETKKGLFSGIGSALNRYVGGLLGEDVESMTPEQRRAARLTALGIIGRGMISPELGAQTLAAIRANQQAEKDKQEAKQRQAAAEALIPQITTRLFGGTPYTQSQVQNIPGLRGVNYASTPMAADPQAALRMMLESQAGRDVAAGMPGLMEMAQQATAPKDYVYQNVAGYGLIAVNRKDPTDRFLVQGEVERPTPIPRRDQFKILTAEEAASYRLPTNRVYKQNLATQDISPVEGSETQAPGTLPSDREAKYQEARSDLRNARNLIENLRTVSREVPAYKSLAGEGAGRLESSYSLALSAIRQLQNSGVLNVGELPFLSKALSDPTTLSSILTSPLQRRKLDGQISTVLGLLDEQQAVLDERFGKISPAAPQENAESPAASGFRRGRKPAAPGADAVKRAEGYY